MMNIFSDIDLMNTAISATMLRKSIISENISNVDTPGYKRKDVRFETILEKEIKKGGTAGLNLKDIEPEIYTDYANSSYRLDGNNVDIDVEMAEEAKVSARYNALVTRVNSQLGRFSTVLQNLK
ncbi:flagellar basal body rod protein FlgB [Cellulosilyticum sp. WCF-2]|nr:flagellar basal body rod protein FlgB [Cellulosilyticum sp. WCF-2]